MPGATANGVPYVIPGDELGDYPATSEDLAEVLDPVFTAVGFNASWANFGGAYEEVSYAKIGSVVHLRGMAKHATTTTTGVVFTLPLGYRPAKQRHYKLDAGPGWAVVLIETDGDVTVASYLNITGAVGSAAHLSFDGVTFDLGA